MKKRIVGEKVEINYKDTLDFFDSRGKNKELEHLYNYVLFQDDSPKLAQKRDKMEKDKISSILNWKTGEAILDLGCGIGRWGEEILKKGNYYIGIDYCENFINIARENLSIYAEQLELYHGTIQQFKDTLMGKCQHTKFDKIFVNGVLMYLNDRDLEKVLYDIISVCGDQCEIYIKETAAAEKRLTLNQIYSEDLTQNYTAIYRSILEYQELFHQIFVEKNGFKILKQDSLFEQELRNRKETLDYYFILGK